MEHDELSDDDGRATRGSTGAGSATGWSTADLFDEHGDLVEVCDTTFLRFGTRRAFGGRCETVRTHENHRTVLEVLRQDGDGRVLVVDAGGDTRVGVMGDRLARIGSDNGWAGVVVNGAIRDSEIIDQLDFGVFAVAVTARRSVDAEPGSRGVDVEFGNARFRSGCWVYADANSVLSSAEELV
jgi:regulator of ribonuclease activity A